MLDEPRVCTGRRSVTSSSSRISIYAFTVCMMVSASGLARCTIPQDDPEQVLALIRDFRPTCFLGPCQPFSVAAGATPAVGEHGLEQVRLFNSGGAPCPVEVMEEFERRIGRPLNEGVRAVGDLAGHALHAAARLAKDGLHRTAIPRHGHEDCGRRDRQARAADRGGGRAVHRGAAGDERLLEQARRQRLRAPTRSRRPRLVHRPYRADGRGRLHAGSSSARRT